MHSTFVSVKFYLTSSNITTAILDVLYFIDLYATSKIDFNFCLDAWPGNILYTIVIKYSRKENNMWMLVVI
jgi:hypothetical protein